MKENFLFSLNTVLPLLLLVLLGYVLKRSRLLPDAFYSASEKMVFKIALPCNLFMNVYNADAKTTFSAPLIVFCVIGTLVTFLLPCIIAPLFIKSNPSRGAFIQGVFRTNFAIIGLPIAQRLFPTNGAAVVSSVMPFVIPLFNVLAVIILTVFAPAEKKLSPKEILKRAVKGILTNPLIISIAIALPFMITGLRLPSPITATTSYLSGTVTPLAMICLGASMDKGIEKRKATLAFTAAFIKVAVSPALLLTAAILLGFRNVELGTVLILFGGPMAVTGYIMAKNMDSDHELSGQILLMSTVLCSITLFIAIYLLAQFSLIEAHSFK